VPLAAPDIHTRSEAVREVAVEEVIAVVGLRKRVVERGGEVEESGRAAGWDRFRAALSTKDNRQFCRRDWANDEKWGGVGGFDVRETVV
jgi:hypothetical protein